MKSVETINENDFLEFYNSRTYNANCFNDDGSIVTFSYIAHEDNKYHEVSLNASQFKIIRYYGFYRKKYSLHTKMIPLIKQHCRNFRKSLLYHQANILLNFNRDPYNCPKCDTKMDFVLCIN